MGKAILVLVGMHILVEALESVGFPKFIGLALRIMSVLLAVHCFNSWMDEKKRNAEAKRNADKE